MSFFAFQSDLPHQLAAVRNVVELFDGLGERSVTSSLDAEDIVGNADEADDLSDVRIEENLHRIRSIHDAEHPEAPLAGGPLVRDVGPMLEGVGVEACSCPHFSVEMETGTGKTYVYLRTMLELHRRYGFTKFIVVVPSVAILEGVKKTFDDTREHFEGLFGTTNFSRRVYDGSRPGIVPAFARDVFPSLLVVTQQSFNRASNNLYKANDRVVSELKPYQWIQRTRPIVVLDEPQNMGSERSKAAIRTLRPLFVLRYSATHRADDQPNLVHRLTPVQAFRLGLVKRVQVTGIAELGVEEEATLHLLDVTRRGARPVAKVRARCLEQNNETCVKELTLTQGDGVFAQTRLPEHEGLVVTNVRAASRGLPAAVELEGGEDGGRVLTTDDLQGSSEQAWRLQIEETIRSHFQRQRELRRHGVKVLSLFFVDRVANYVGDDPRIRSLFDECFDALKKREPDFERFEAAEVREAHFAKATRRKKGGGEEEVFLDVVGDDSKEARAAFELIMRRKEVLLSFPNEEEPGSKVAFVFAHSALREGWDNPNVFQICTLNQTVSVMRKRQEIGRGLRLCVNQKGERVTDPALNVLTVVANESYESYVRTLQTEYREAGDQAPPSPTRPGEGSARRSETSTRDAAFERLWSELSPRLEHLIEVDTEVLVREAIARLEDSMSTQFSKPTLTVTRGRFVIDPVLEPAELHVRSANEAQLIESEGHRFSGTRSDDGPACEVVATHVDRSIPDFFGRAAEATFLTRATLRRIFRGVSQARKETLRAHPEGWANTFVRVVGDVTKDHVLDRLRFRDADAGDDGLESILRALPEAALVARRELADAHLRPDEESLVACFELPPGFRVGLPGILSEHSPAWGILRRRKGARLSLGLARSLEGLRLDGAAQPPAEGEGVEPKRRGSEASALKKLRRN